MRGVIALESGYCNGHLPQPTYEQVCSGHSGHAEVVRLTFEPQQLPLETVLEVFFTIHDPTTPNRQGHDVGTQYRSGIYTQSAPQHAQVQAFVAALAAQGTFEQPVVTEVVPLGLYQRAEEAHQRFFERHPHHGYCMAVAAPKVALLRRSWAHLLR